MSTGQNKSLWLWVTFIAFVMMAATIIVGYTVVNNYEKERDEATTKTISEILKQESKAHPLLPDVLVLNISTKDKKQFSDSIRNEISKYLIDRYTKKSNDTSQIEIHPYVSFLEKANNKPITGEQVEELKKHIQFLVSTCDKAVEDSKRNIDTEMNKINTWVTVWIGVLGFLGIFIPILVNIKSFDTLKEVEKKAKEADEKITKHEPSINAIEGIKEKVETAERKINEINEKLPGITQQSEKAITDSNSAITQSKDNQRVIQAMEAILKLSKLQNIVLYAGGNINQLIYSLLSSFLRSFRSIDDSYNKALYQDLLLEFFDRITELGRSTILRNRVNTQAISDFASFLNGKITAENPLTKNDHDEIVTRFEAMLNAIK